MAELKISKEVRQMWRTCCAPDSMEDSLVTQRGINKILDDVETLERQLADEELVFNHANETIGKLEADLQEARKAALEEAARIADKIGEQAADGSIVSPLGRGSNTANALPAQWAKALSAEKERIWKARGSIPRDRRK